MLKVRTTMIVMTVFFLIMVNSGLLPQLAQAKSLSELTTDFIRHGEEATAISMLIDYENSM